MLFLFPLFHDYHFSVNNNPYTSHIQSYVAVLNMLQNTDRNDEQNTNGASEIILVFNLVIFLTF